MQRKDLMLLTPVIFLAVLLLSINITKPFFGHHDWNGVWYGTIARNHLRMGLSETKLGSVGGNDLQVTSSHAFFTHYPPLFPLILAMGMAVLGQSEWVLRAIAIFFSLHTLVGMYLVGRAIKNREVGFLASLIALVTPLFLYFGKMPVHEIMLLPCIIYTIYFYILWLRFGKQWQWRALIVSLTFGLLITWPIYPLPFFLLVHYLLFHPSKKHWRRFLLLNVLPVGIFFAHLIHVKFLTGSFLAGGLVEIFTTRISSENTTSLYTLTMGKYLANEFAFLKIYFTKIVLGLAGLGFVLVVINRFKNGNLSFLRSTSEESRGTIYIDYPVKLGIDKRISVLLLFLIIGLFYLVIFKEAAYIHDYLIYYLLPFFALSAAWTLDLVLRFIPNNTIRFSILLLVILLIATERREYVAALLKSNHSQKGYEIGVFIREHIQVGETSLIGSQFYQEFFSPFITYYSQRGVAYGTVIEAKDFPAYQLIIRPKAHDAMTDESKALLETHCTRAENDQYIWYTQCR